MVVFFSHLFWILLKVFRVECHKVQQWGLSSRGQQLLWFPLLCVAVTSCLSQNASAGCVCFSFRDEKKAKHHRGCSALEPVNRRGGRGATAASGPQFVYGHLSVKWLGPVFFVIKLWTPTLWSTIANFLKITNFCHNTTNVIKSQHGKTVTL